MFLLELVDQFNVLLLRILHGEVLDLLPSTVFRLGLEGEQMVSLFVSLKEGKIRRTNLKCQKSLWLLDL